MDAAGPGRRTRPGPGLAPQRQPSRAAAAGSIATPGSAGATSGLEPFRRLVNDPRFRSVPMILETPKGTEDGEELDAVNLRVLRQLERPSSVTA